MRKILITGANGQVAYELLKYAPKHFDIIACDKDTLDITNEKHIKKFIQQLKPSIIINTAAYTKVDLAESEQAAAFAINAEGAKYIADACQEVDAILFHLSTDYVFDGKHDKPYTEHDTPAPLNVYGHSKLLGEQAIQQHCERHIILRINSVFGEHGANFVKSILRLAKEREQLSIVNDQFMGPTPAISVAKTVWYLCDTVQQQWGLYHYSGIPSLTWCQFAKKIIEVAASFQSLAVKKIEPITSEQFAAKAQRPKNSVLDCQLLKKTFNIDQPNWERELAHVIETLSAS